MEEILIKISNRIKSQRTKMDLSQAKLAKLAKIDTSELLYIEKGKRNLTLNTLRKIAKALNLTLSNLTK